MRHWILLGWMLLAIAGPVELRSEQTPTSVWKIEGPGCAVYLAGSVHLLKPGDYPLPEAFERAYADSKTLYFETSLDEMAKPQTQEQFLKWGTYPHGQSIQQDLTPGTYQKLVDFTGKQAGLPMPVLGRMKPWMAAVTLSVVELQRLGAQPDKGVDHYFNTRARKDGKTRKYFETVEFQMKLFGQLNQEEQEAMLLETLDSLALVGEEFDRMVASWRAGNTRDLEELFLKCMKQHPKLMEILLYQRNRNWIPEIEKMLAGPDTTLIIVGAAHLAGEKSVLDLLQKAGHTTVQQ